MSSDRIRIGVVDSGYAAHQVVAASAAFVLHDQQLWLDDNKPDQLNHGSRVIEVIEALAPEAELVSAQVFQARYTTSAAQVAAAIDWLVDQDVQVINLSLGLRNDSAGLREACQRAATKGVILCAASPARGDPVFPAAYPGVFRMTGDARCARNEISYLDSRFADFGACVRPMDNAIGSSGASLGCAHLTALVARYLQSSGPASVGAVHTWLQTQASYQGPERRVVAHG